MIATIKLKRKVITGQVVVWNEKDPGTKKYAGSVYFDNINYSGFINHDGTVTVFRAGRNIGKFTPENFVIA